jgi:hypothetical protein
MDVEDDEVSNHFETARTATSVERGGSRSAEAAATKAGRKK